MSIKSDEIDRKSQDGEEDKTKVQNENGGEDVSRMIVRVKLLIDGDKAVNLRLISSQDGEDNMGKIMKIDVCKYVKSPPERRPFLKCKEGP